MVVPSLSSCQQASFSAENTKITVVPAFSHSGPLPLLSTPHQSAVGPFVAGMPLEVPLWMAKLLHQKQLAQIQLPEWLAVDYLSAILKEEQTSELLTNHLPFFYYEIARSLTQIVATASSSGAGGDLVTTTNASPKAALVVLQDLVAIRVDKIRQNFHSLSKDTMEAQNDDLNMIAVTGIASVELNKVGPFLQKAFTEYGSFVQPPQGEEEENSEQTTSTAKEGLEKAGTFPASSQESIKKVAVARSRLRRFRQ